MKFMINFLPIGVKFPPALVDRPCLIDDVKTPRFLASANLVAKVLGLTCNFCDNIDVGLFGLR